MDVLQPLRDVAREVFADTPVLFAYLFGSQATGRTHPRSDVDVAVYLDEAVPPDQRLDLSLRLAGTLERACRVGPVEALLVLNDARIALAGRVLAERQVLFVRDEPARVRYESLTFRQFHDFEQHARPLRQQRLAAIARGDA
ncbi:MAG: nucleotidyltransferase domain-containing protein [Egibacteraceae bacterium]